MRTDLDVVKLQAVKDRMEMLLQYYRTMGEREGASAQVMEAQLRAVVTELESRSRGRHRWVARSALGRA